MEIDWLESHLLLLPCDIYKSSVSSLKSDTDAYTVAVGFMFLKFFCDTEIARTGGGICTGIKVVDDGRIIV